MASGPRKICRFPTRCPTTNKNSTMPDTAMTYFLPSDDPNMFVTILMGPPNAVETQRQSTDPPALTSMTHKRVLAAPQNCLTEANRRRNPGRQFGQRMNPLGAARVDITLKLQRVEAR